MSDTVALVAIGRVVQTIQDKVTVSKSLIEHLCSTRKITPAEAKNHILSAAAERALAYAKGDEKVAATALVIVDCRTNRLAQCARLLRRHHPHSVEIAYEIKDDLTTSNPSLRQLCQMVEQTDEDMDGEAYRLRGLLEELGMRALSKRQEWYFHNRIRQGLAAGRLIEAIQDEILADIQHLRPDPDGYGEENAV